MKRTTCPDVEQISTDRFEHLEHHSVNVSKRDRAPLRILSSRKRCTSLCSASSSGSPQTGDRTTFAPPLASSRPHRNNACGGNNRSTRLPTSMQRIKEHGCHLPSSFLQSNFSTVKSAPEELMEKEEHHHVSCTSDVVLVQTLMCKPTLSELRLEGLADSGLWKQQLKLHDQQRWNCPPQCRASGSPG